jgi:hypothetical protein
VFFVASLWGALMQHSIECLRFKKREKAVIRTLKKYNLLGSETEGAGVTTPTATAAIETG